MKFPKHLFRFNPRRVVLVGLPVLVLGLVLGIFFFRAPVIVISDASFDALYGFRRTLIRQAGLSMRFFRSVKRVLIAENANPEATVFAIEERESRPWAVLGHARYTRGLEQYAAEHPDIRVTIVREGTPVQADGVFSDARLNSWRAGRSAALLAGETTGIVLIYQDGRDFPVNQEAFSAGLREENENLTAAVLNCASDYFAWDQVCCVVVCGPANFYFDRKDAIPAILYTWMDPALSSSSVKVVADDSLWALAAQILEESGASGEARTAAAGFIIPRGRVGDPELRGKLKKAIREEIPTRFSW